MQRRARRFGWELPRNSIYEALTGWFLLFGMRLTSAARERHGKLVFLLLETEQKHLVDEAILRLTQHPREWRRIQRQFDYVVVAPGQSELRLPARIAFVSRDASGSPSELAIELNQLAILGWHTQIGGGFDSPRSSTAVRASIARSSRRFAERVLEGEPDASVHSRVRARYWPPG